jgi:hypothetical protein
MHELVEGYVRSAKIAQILDLGGNDWDKHKRVLKANEFAKVEGKTLIVVAGIGGFVRQEGGRRPFHIICGECARFLPVQTTTG